MPKIAGFGSNESKSAGRWAVLDGLGKKLSIYQSLYNKYNDVIQYVARKTQTPVIDLRELIRSPGKRNIYTDTMHLNEAGAEVYGAYIAAQIKPRVAQMLERKSTSASTISSRETP